MNANPTKWQAEHCTTHHHACDCREWEHATRVAALERDAEAKDAEIEALRAKASEHRDGRLAALERAERLAEALRLAEEYINSLPPEWYSAGQRVLAAIREALHPTAAQEDGRE